MAEEREVDLPQLERGGDLSRIFAFTDGVYAIAITLLVLQIDVPAGITGDGSLWSGIREEGPDLLAFAISFAVIGMNWVGAHRFMRTVKEYDRGLMLLTLLSLFFIVLIPFTSQLMGEYADQADLSVVFYILNMSCVVYTTALMQRHVLRAGLGRPEYHRDTELSYRSSLFTGTYFMLTIPLAFVLSSFVFFLWFGLRLDPYQRKRDDAYRTSRRRPERP